MPDAEIADMRIKSLNGMTYIVLDAWATSLVIAPAGPGYHQWGMYRPAHR